MILSHRLKIQKYRSGLQSNPFEGPSKAPHSGIEPDVCFARLSQMLRFHQRSFWTILHRSCPSPIPQFHVSELLLEEVMQVLDILGEDP